MKPYEGMFLVEPTVAAREWPKAEGEIRTILEKNGAAVAGINKWGERKLAFPVRRSHRGTYVLAYFSAGEQTIAKIRADFQLSDVVLRHLIVLQEGDVRKEPSRDFETAGLVPLRKSFEGGGDAGTRSFGPPRSQEHRT